MNKRKYTLNEDYFNNIDNSEKAYFLGFLYADGYNDEKTGCISINLQSSDIKILESLAKLIDSNNYPKLIKRIHLNKNWQDCYHFTFNSKKMSLRLKELGCPVCKSFILKFPTPEQVPEHLIHHFIRGYFDGDGCISYHTLKGKRPYFKGNIFIVGTENICIGIKNILEKYIDVNCSILIKNKRYNNKKYPIRTLTIGGNRQIQRFLKWLYNETTIHLERKYNKSQEFIKKSEIQNLEFNDRRHIKMTFENANIIRERYKNTNIKQTELAKEFNVSKHIINKIINNKIWNQPFKHQ